MTLEMLALVRAQEQLDAGAWRKADRGEALVKLPRVCAVCGHDAPRVSGREPEVVICRECKAEGWRTKLCIRCGERPIHHRDYTSSLPKVCGSCRATIQAEKELL